MDQLDLFGNKIDNTNRTILPGGNNQILNGSYKYLPSFFNKKQSDDYFKILRESVQWKQESMNMYGKQVNFPRLTAWYGDNDKSYSFSGIKLNPNQWTNEIKEIKKLIETKSKVIYNSVLLNLYRNGNDSISWHSDAEKELGINPVIGSINFGATRIFQLRHIVTKEKIEIELGHGSLLIMEGELQHYWQHQVPKTSKHVGERINLTFRVIN